MVFAQLYVHYFVFAQLQMQSAAARLFVQTLQLHLQGLQEALPLDQLALSPPQSLVALPHLALHRLQLEHRTQ